MEQIKSQNQVEADEESSFPSIGEENHIELQHIQSVKTQQMSSNVNPVDKIKTYKRNFHDQPMTFNIQEQQSETSINTLVLQRQIHNFDNEANCPICYNLMNDQPDPNQKFYTNSHNEQVYRMVTLKTCNHQFCEDCFTQNVQHNVNTYGYSGSLQILCPEHTCRRVLQESEFKAFLDEEQYTKYKSYENNREVLLDGSRKFCPWPNCENVINLKELSKTGSKYECAKCQRAVCRKCVNQWHEGKTCQQYEIEILGDFASQDQASKCPKCKTRVEKMNGCMHMKCPFCKFEYCFVCGLPYLSIFHYSQYGGLVCEMIGGSFFQKKKVRATILTLLTIIFLPLVVIFFGMIVTGTGFQVFSEALYNSRWFQPMRQSFLFNRIGPSHTKCGCCQDILKIIVRIFFYALYIILLIALSITLGAVVGVVACLPCYFILVFALVRVCVVSKRNKAIAQMTVSKNSQLTPQQ